MSVLDGLFVSASSVSGALGLKGWFLFALAGAILTSAISIIEKRVLQHEHSLSFSAGHAFSVLLISLPFLWFADFSKVTLGLALLLYVATALAAIAFWLSAKAVKHLEISVFSPLMVVNLAFVPLLAFLFIGEKLSLQQFAGIALIALGVIALELITHHGKLFPVITTSGKEAYFSFAVFSAFLYAITAIVDKIALSNLDVFTYLLLTHLFIAFNSLILIAVLDKRFKQDLKALFSQDPRLVMTVALLSVGQRLLLSIAISSAFLSLSMAVKRLSVFFSTILGGKLFHEENLGEKAAISIIMLAGALLLAFS